VGGGFPAGALPMKQFAREVGAAVTLSQEHTAVSWLFNRLIWLFAAVDVLQLLCKLLQVQE